MNSLVSYASSDSEAEDDVAPERPAKIAKIDPSPVIEPGRSTEVTDATIGKRGGELIEVEAPAPATATKQPQPEPSPQQAQPEPQLSAAPIGPSIPSSNEIQGPLAPNLETEQPSTSAPTSPPQSPYTSTRSTLHDLTLPRHPNFSIPPSPPAPADPEARAALAATSKKFAKFLDLKRQARPVHFHDRLLSSSALRNPGMLAGLLGFAGVGEGDLSAGTLPDGVVGDDEGGNGREGGGVPVKWGDGWYVENLMREGSRRRKLAERKKGEDVQFVAAAGSNAAGTASDAGRRAGDDGVKPAKRSKFDER